MRFLALSFLFVVLPMTVLAADTGDVPQYVQNIDYTLEQPFGGESTITNLAQYIQLVYQFGLGIMGIIAVVLIMFGGLRWIAAAGNESVISEAKEIIVSAVTGLVIGLLSYVILLFINPQTTDLSLSVFQIPNTLSDTSITDLLPCTDAQFTGRDCQIDGSGSKKCDQISCNEIGYYNNQYCRGTMCSIDGEKCYDNPNDIGEGYICQLASCGKWVNDCVAGNYTRYKISSKTTDEEAMHTCACGFYLKNPMKSLGAPTDDIFALTADQRTYWGQLCDEDRAQSDWVEFFESAGISNSDQVIWNCQTESNPEGMGCEFELSTVGACIPE